MKGHSFIQQTKLGNVTGRIKYISSRAKQEHLYAVYETNPAPFWKELAKECQAEFKRSGAQGKCIEARELIIALPPSLINYEPNALLEQITDAFKEKYGVECSSALHHNKRKTNYHIHLVYSERELLEEPVRKIATRNRYYDENGRTVRTKKEVCENGFLRPGCNMIAKGEVYEEHLFDKKKVIFKDKGFLETVKEDFTEMINELSSPNEKLKVFDRNGPYLPTKKVGKNNPRAKEIASENRTRDSYNARVNDALNIGIQREKLIEFKKQEVYRPLRELPKEEAAVPGMFERIIDWAQMTVARMIAKLFYRAEEYKKNVQDNHWKEFVDDCRVPLIKPKDRSNERNR